MIELARDGLRVQLDPAHGAEVLVVSGRDGTNVLAVAHSPAPPRHGELSTDDWLRQYRGGWQLCAPNVGAPGEVRGVRHGFHGRASVDAWAVASVAADSATVEWAGHGLRLERRIELVDGRVRAATTIECERSEVPCLVLEHIALSPTALGLPVLLEVPRGAAGTDDLPDRLEAKVADVTWIVDAAPRRCRAAGRRAGVTVSWSGWPRHLWIWRELHATASYWDGRGEFLGIEVGNVAGGDGIGGGLGADAWMERGERRVVEIELELEPAR